MTIALRYAARSDVGLLREGNEDSAYAGPRLLAVADGMGGHAHGEVASSVAIAAIAGLDNDITDNNLLPSLEAAVRDANRRLHEMVSQDPSLKGMGTTLTAMLWSGRHIAVAHVGDSRAYLLRAGELYQVTDDHTLVNQLVKDGRITEDEAATHPQRSILLRALDGSGEVEPDMNMREAQIGDRYLLCSDGLSGVVSPETLHGVLTSVADPEDAVIELVDLANRGGGPDNITCVVADVIEFAQDLPMASAPAVVGAAGLNRVGRTEPPDTPAGRANMALSGNVPGHAAADMPGDITSMQPMAVPGASAQADPSTGEYFAGEAPTIPQEIIREDIARDTEEVPRPRAGEAADRRQPRRRRSRGWLWIAIAVIVIVLGAGGYLGWRAIFSQFSIGVSGDGTGGSVAIYEGSYGMSVGPINLYQQVHDTRIPVSSLKPGDRQRVAQGMTGFGDRQAAQRTVDDLEAGTGGEQGDDASPTPGETSGGGTG